MKQYIDELISLADSWPAKISVSSISLMLTDALGGGQWMLSAIQYLTFADLVLGVVDALRRKQFKPEILAKGVNKITSLYIALVIVGIGTHAIDKVTGGISIFGITGSTLYDLFILYLITCELVCINQYCANMGFLINRKLTEYLSAINTGVERRIKEFLSNGK